MGPINFGFRSFMPSCITEHERKEVLKTQLKRRFDNHAKRSDRERENIER